MGSASEFEIHGITKLGPKQLILREGLVDRGRLLAGAFVFSWPVLFFVRIGLQGYPWAYVPGGLFVLLVLFTVKSTFANAGLLELSQEGFRVINAEKKADFYRWIDIDHFECYTFDKMTSVVWFYKDGHPGGHLGTHGTFPFDYGMTKSSLVTLMESWRQKYSN